MTPPDPPGPAWLVEVPALPPAVLARIQDRFTTAGATWRVVRMSRAGASYLVTGDPLVLNKILDDGAPDGGWEIVHPTLAPARTLQELAGFLIGYAEDPGRTVVPPLLRGHEFVAHVLVALAGPLVVDDHRYVLKLWRQVVTRFSLDGRLGEVPADPPTPLPRMAEGDAVLAARTGRGPGRHQIVLRRLGGLLCVSVLRAPLPRDGVRWAALTAEWEAVLPAPTPGLVGSVQILQARTAAAGPLPDPAALAAAVATDSGIAGDRWGACALLQQPPWGPFAVWEESAGVPGQPAREERSRRRVAVVAPHDHEGELSTWTWDDGTKLPWFAQYLRNAATVRYELRVRNAADAALRQAHEAAAEVDARVRPVLRSGGVFDATRAPGVRAEVAAARARLAELAAVLRPLRETVDAAAAAMRIYSGTDAETGPFAEDARVAARLLARTGTDLGRLDGDLRVLRSADATVAGTEPQPASAVEDSEPPAAVARTHGLVVEAAGLVNAEQFRAGLCNNHTVCKIEVATGGTVEYGTGFLVGPDLVLTCHHLLEEIIDNGASPTGVRCGFGFQMQPDGTVQWPDAYGLARDWLVAKSPHARGEGSRGRAVRPGPDQLDYALVRLESRAGDRAPPGRQTPRGWVTLSSRARKPAPGTSLVVIQHPGGAPLKLSVSSTGVLSVEHDGPRLIHGANTMAGSSGAPCFTFEFELVAMHLGIAGTEGKRAVPIADIVDHLVAGGHGGVLDVVPEEPA